MRAASAALQQRNEAGGGPEVDKGNCFRRIHASPQNGIEVVLGQSVMCKYAPDRICAATHQLDAWQLVRPAGQRAGSPIQQGIIHSMNNLNKRIALKIVANLVQAITCGEFRRTEK